MAGIIYFEQHPNKTTMQYAKRIFTFFTVVTLLIACSKDENTSRLNSFSGKLKSVTGPDTINQVAMSFHYDDAGRVDSMFNGNHYFKFWYAGDAIVPYFFTDSLFNINFNTSTILRNSVRYDNLNRPIWDSTMKRTYNHITGQISEITSNLDLRSYRYENNYRLILLPPPYSSVADTIFYQADSSIIRSHRFYNNTSYQRVDYFAPYIPLVNPLWNLNIRQTINDKFFISYGANNQVWATKYYPTKLTTQNPPYFIIQDGERYEEIRTAETDAQNRIHIIRTKINVYSGNAPYGLLDSVSTSVYFNYYP